MINPPSNVTVGLEFFIEKQLYKRLNEIYGSLKEIVAEKYGATSTKTKKRKFSGITYTEISLDPVSLEDILKTIQNYLNNSQSSFSGHYSLQSGINEVKIHRIGLKTSGGLDYRFQKLFQPRAFIHLTLSDNTYEDLPYFWKLYINNRAINMWVDKPYEYCPTYNIEICVSIKGVNEPIISFKKKSNKLDLIIDYLQEILYKLQTLNDHKSELIILKNISSELDTLINSSTFIKELSTFERSLLEELVIKEAVFKEIRIGKYTFKVNVSIDNACKQVSRTTLIELFSEMYNDLILDSWVMLSQLATAAWIAGPIFYNSSEGMRFIPNEALSRYKINNKGVLHEIMGLPVGILASGRLVFSTDYTIPLLTLLLHKPILYNRIGYAYVSHSIEKRDDSELGDILSIEQELGRRIAINNIGDLYEFRNYVLAMQTEFNTLARSSLPFFSILQLNTVIRYIESQKERKWSPEDIGKLINDSSILIEE